MSKILAQFGLARQLMSPLRYYDFFNGPKLVIDAIAPLFFAILTWILFSYVPQGVSFIGDHGFIGSINGLLQLLVGFFVAGLAMVFGARSQALEQGPIGFRFVGAVGSDERNGVKITRRMFVCSLFAYLSFISFAVFLLGVLAITCASLLHSVEIPLLVRNGAKFIYLCFVWNIFFVTLYGFYYMSDRMHRADPEVVERPAVGDRDD